MGSFPAMARTGYETPSLQSSPHHLISSFKSLRDHLAFYEILIVYDIIPDDWQRTRVSDSLHLAGPISNADSLLDVSALGRVGGVLSQVPVGI